MLPPYPALFWTGAGGPASNRNSTDCRDTYLQIGGKWNVDVTYTPCFGDFPSFLSRSFLESVGAELLPPAALFRELPFDSVGLFFIFASVKRPRSLGKPEIPLWVSVSSLPLVYNVSCSKTRGRNCRLHNAAIHVSVWMAARFNVL